MLDDNYSDSFDDIEESIPGTKTNSNKADTNVQKNNSIGVYRKSTDKPFTLEDDDQDLDFGAPPITKDKKVAPIVEDKKEEKDDSDDDGDYEDDDFDDEEEELFKRTATEFANKLKELQISNQMVAEAKAKLKVAQQPTYIPKQVTNLAIQESPTQSTTKLKAPQPKAATLPPNIPAKIPAANKSSLRTKE